MKYSVGDNIRYRIGGVKFLNGTIIPSTEKEGVIEEALRALDGSPCYWVEGEKVLILENAILGII